MTGFAWSEERIAALRQLTAAGLSAAQIAAQLGITRNAVCGKWLRDRGPNVAPRPRVAPKPKPKPAPIMRPAVPVPDVAPVSLNIDIMALTSTTCKWPVNDGNPYRFCGADKPAEGSPYCPYHARVASGGISGRRNPAA